MSSFKARKIWVLEVLKNVIVIYRAKYGFTHNWSGLCLSSGTLPVNFRFAITISISIAISALTCLFVSFLSPDRKHASTQEHPT